MRTKEEYDAMVRFQEKYKDDPKFVEEQLAKIWNKIPKIVLNVSEWDDVFEGKETSNWFCSIEQPKLGEGRIINMGTGIGGVKNLLKMISREEFVLCYEIVANGKPYDAGEFWDKIMKLDES